MKKDDRLKVQLEERELFYMQDPKRIIVIAISIFYIILALIAATLGLLNFFESQLIGLLEMCTAILIAMLACFRPGKIRVIL